MMTLTQTERLVRKIAEVAAQPPADTQTAKLAHDYAELCRAANRRLEQCALMIEAGQFLQALQLAETAPPLMDLVTLLGFRQSSDWRAYCQSHQLPWAEPFYDKYIRLVNEAYGKGIASDHPFYRDYRRAVLENDDARAFSILRVIARLNPSDQNTREEMKRLEEKLLRVKLENLRQVVAAGDASNIQTTLEQLEASGLPVPASHPAWQQAQVARCLQMLRRAEDLRQQDNWQEAEAVVEDIHSVATRYNLRLPDADADIWTALEEWTTQKRTAYAAQQDFKRAVSALEYEMDSLAPRRATGGRLDKAEATASYGSLSEKWRQVEQFNEPLPEELAAEHDKCSGWLRQEIQSANRRRRVIGIAATLILLAAIGAAIPFILRATRQQSYERQLQGLESARKVGDVESVLVSAPQAWKADPRMAGSIAQAREFLAREKQLTQNFTQKLTGLQAMAADFGNSLDQIGPARAGCGQTLNQMASEYQTSASSALATWDNQWQTFRNAKLAGMLNHAEETADLLNATNGVEPVRAAVKEIKSMFSVMAPMEAQPPPLEQGIVDRLSSLTNKVETWSATAGKWDQDRRSLTNAESLAQYLEALDPLALSPFATVAQKTGAAKIDILQINSEMLLGQLLAPNDNSMWDSLTNVTGWNVNLMPEQPTSQEKDLYFKLRDDKNIRDVNAYELITNARPNNPYRSHPVFVQGAIAFDNGGSEAGMIHDPAIYRDTLHFTHTAYSDWDYSQVKRLYRTLECDSYERLGLGDLIDPNTGNYQKPILQIFDQLNEETKASAVFRAYVTFRLLAVAQARPAEWGFAWCPGVAAHIQALTALDANEIKSGDWMVPERSEKFEGKLEAYFEKARAVPLEKQARFLQQLTRETCAKGFVFAGFVDVAGHPVARPLAGPSDELCGWNQDGVATILFRKAPGGDAYAPVAEALPYSPLFAFAGDRRELLLHVLGASGYPAALAKPILPPFFAGGL